MSLAAGTELDQLHRLARVEIEDEAQPVAEAQRIRRRAAQSAVDEALVLEPRKLQRAAVVIAAAGLVDLFGHACAQLGAERLPLHGQHPVALQVAEGAVVGDDLKPVAKRLEAAPGPMAAVVALAHQLVQQGRALVL